MDCERPLRELGVLREHWSAAGPLGQLIVCIFAEHDVLLVSETHFHARLCTCVTRKSCRLKFVRLLSHGTGWGACFEGPIMYAVKLRKFPVGKLGGYDIPLNLLHPQVDKLSFELRATPYDEGQ